MTLVALAWVVLIVSSAPAGIRIAAGYEHGLLIREDGAVWAFGANFSGQLGNPDVVHFSALPVPVLIDAAAAVAAGYNRSFFLKADGTVWQAGENEFEPVPVMSGVKAISAGDQHALFLKTDGTVWASGINNNGQLGDGTTIPRWEPVMVMSGVADISAGYSHSLFLKTDGTVWACGANASGQLGDGTNQTRLLPVQVWSEASAVSAGGNFSLFLKTDGSAWAAGSDNFQPIGVGAASMRLLPVQVLTGVASIAAGARHGFFVKSDGSLWGSGDNDSGQLGLGDRTDRLNPVRIRTGVAAAAGGDKFSLFLGTDGSVWSCGFNQKGQLGEGTSDDSTLPVVISARVLEQTTGSVTGVGGSAELTVNAQGGTALVYQWYRGESGDISHPVPGATSPVYTTPALAAAARYWVRVANTWSAQDGATIEVGITLAPTLLNQSVGARVARGQDASLAVAASGNGLAYQWYAGVRGDLSQPVAGANGPQLTLTAPSASGSYWARVSNSHGHVDSVTMPVLVGENAVASGYGHTVFIKADGSAWTTGANTDGQLGDGSTDDHATPVEVLSDVFMAATGDGFTLFLKTNGTAWAVGLNDRGQFGDGSRTNRLQPVEVTRGVRAVAAGRSHTLFLKMDNSVWAAGRNEGRLGDGGRLERATAVRVLGEVGAVAAGGSHSFFLKLDGTMWASGENNYGQLGDGQRVARLSPVPILADVRSVATAENHSLFVKNDGTAWACGNNSNGQLGIPYQYGDRDVPVQMMSDVNAVAAGGAPHSLFLKTDGTVWACGNDTGGALGVGSYADKSLPVAVRGSVRAMAAGSSCSFFLDQDGSIWATGASVYGQLGDGWFEGYASRRVPACVLPVVQAQDVALSVGHGGVARPNLVIAGVNLAYQWFEGKHGDVSRPVAGANGRFFTSPVLTGSTSYWVRIDNGWHTVDSATIDVSHHPRPSIVEQTVRARIGFGQSATLTVVATSPAGDAPTYQWFTGESGDVSQPLAGATAAQLVTAPLHASTRVWARVSNSQGHVDGETIPVFVGETSLAAGGSHTLLLKSDGTVWATGSNSSGRLGDGTISDRSSPVFILGDVQAIAAGSTHSLFLKNDGTAWAVGSATVGRLGDGGGSSYQLVPVQVLSDVRSIAAGDTHSLFLTNDGTAWGAGDLRDGQLGLDSSAEPETFALLTPTPILRGVRAIAAGTSHSLFLRTDGTVWACGGNYYGQVGGVGPQRTMPAPVLGGVRAIAAGSTHSLFLKEDGTVFACGRNESGQLGNGTNIDQPVPARVPALTGIGAIAAGYDHSLFLRADGTLLASGANAKGQLGDGTTSGRNLPLPVPGLGEVRAITAGYRFSLACRSDGSVWSFGANTYGQLGDGSTGDRRVPTQISVSIASQPTLVTGAHEEDILLSVETVGPGRTFQWYAGQSGDVSAPISGATQRFLLVPAPADDAPFWLRVSNGWSSADSATITADSTSRPSIVTQTVGDVATVSGAATLRVQAVGPGLSYQWYLGQPGDTLEPVAGADAPELVVTAPAASRTYWVRVSNVHGHTDSLPVRVCVGEVVLAAGGDRSFVLLPDGAAWAWGDNTYGQLGDGSTTSRVFPVPVLSDVVAIAAGPHHTLFLKNDGTAWACGRNTDGRLGDGTTTARPLPVQVLSDVRALAAGATHSLFLKHNGTVWACGSNSSGQLGDGTNTGRLIPVQAAGDGVAIAAGGSHSLVLKNDGTAWSTGANSSGQLGVGTTSASAAFVPVMSRVVALVAGEYHSLLLRSGGEAWGFGRNSAGELGDGSRTSRSSPAFVVGGVRALAAGASHSAFLQIDDTLRMSGANASGQLGDGTNVIRDTPSPVMDGVATIALGTNHSLARKGDGAIYAFGANALRQLGAGASAASLSLPTRIDAHIVEQSASALALTGVGVHLGVVAGPALVNYQWFEGVSGDTTRPVVGATQARFTTPVLTAATAYWVRVDSGWSVRNSATIPVEFSGRPNLIAQSPGARVITGQSVTLTVQALGEDLSFAWYEGEAGDLSRPVPGASASSFAPPSTASDTAYWVRISNAHGHADSRTIPLEVNHPVVASAGASHSLFLKADGTVWATGSNIYGQQTGIPPITRATPAQIMSEVYAISAGDNYSLFLRTDGTVWACGYNADGQLGDGTTTHRAVPVQVLSNARAIAAGPSHSLFLKNDGTAWASGSNANGELGDGTTTRRLTPVFALDRVVAIATGGVRAFSVPGVPLNGGGHSLFLRDDAQAWACGANTFGQLGDGTTTARVLPVPVLAGVKAIAAAYSPDLSLSAASAHSLFLKTDGTAWGSGKNLNGQLGLSGGGSQLSPILILDEVEAIHAGSHHSFFVRTGGDAWACGRDQSGQLGLGATSGRRELGLVRTNVASLATGVGHTFFVSPEASLFAVGSNSSGLLGDGTVINRLAPTPLNPVIVTPPARQAGSVFSELVASPAETLSYQWYLGASGDVSRPLADIAGPRAWLRADFGPTSYWVRVSNWLGHVDSATVVALPAYDLWAHRFTLAGADPSPEADADRDGLPNLLEYALGSDPLVAQGTGSPVSEVGLIEGEARLGLTFTRIADPSLIYEVRASGDLAAWQTIWGSMGDDNAAGPVTVHDSVALAAAPRRFLLLRVTR